MRGVARSGEKAPYTAPAEPLASLLSDLRQVTRQEVGGLRRDKNCRLVNKRKPFAARWHFIPHDYWRYTPSCLRRLLEAAGFADVQVYARGNALTVACYKVMALILPLLMPQQRQGLIAIASRLAGLACLPLLALLAAVGTLSLRGSGGNDCLGYTVVAQKRG